MARIVFGLRRGIRGKRGAEEGEAHGNATCRGGLCR